MPDFTRAELVEWLRINADRYRREADKAVDLHGLKGSRMIVATKFKAAAEMLDDGGPSIHRSGLTRCPLCDARFDTSA